MLWWLVVLGAFFAIVILTLQTVALMSPSTIAGRDAPWLPGLIVFLGAKYVEGRFGMVFPATAIGKRMILSTSWTLTMGNGIRLAIALSIPWGIFLILFSTLVTPLLFLSQPFGLLAAFLLAVFTTAVEIATLSRAYRYLETAEYEPDGIS